MKLLPCPWCQNSRFACVEKPMYPPIVYYSCADTACPGSQVSVTLDIWNRRAPDAVKERLAEACRVSLNAMEAVETWERAEVVRSALAAYDAERQEASDGRS